MRIKIYVDHERNRKCINHQKDGNKSHSLYFETESGEKILLSKELSMWEGRTFDVAMKANEFFRSPAEITDFDRLKNEN